MYEENMNTKYFYFSVFLFVGYALTCNAQSIPKDKILTESYQKHPDFGEVKSDHPEFVKAVKECEVSIYENGVTIDGVLVKSRTELNNISSDHMSIYMKKRIVEKLNVPDAYKEASTAMKLSPFEGEIQSKSKSKPKEYVDYLKEYFDLPHSKELSEINTLNESYIKCMRNDKHWTPSKMIKRNAETGAVISEF